MTDPSTPGRPAAFFDLDKTVLATSASTAFARAFLSGGLLTRRAALRTAYAQLAFVLGAADEAGTERVRVQLSRLVTGWDVALVRRLVAEHLDDSVRPVLHAEALERIAAHHAAGEEVVIVSASSHELVAPVAGLVGADQVVASRMEVRDGRYTGEIAFYAYGPAKAVAMRELAEQRGYDLAASTAYTDSVTDAPMLAAVGHGVVVNPDRALRAVAETAGWDTVRWHRVGRPRPARRTRRRVTVLTGLGVAALAVAVVALRPRPALVHRVDARPTCRARVPR